MGMKFVTVKDTQATLWIPGLSRTHPVFLVDAPSGGDGGSGGGLEFAPEAPTDLVRPQGSVVLDTLTGVFYQQENADADTPEWEDKYHLPTGGGGVAWSEFTGLPDPDGDGVYTVVADAQYVVEDITVPIGTMLRVQSWVRQVSVGGGNNIGFFINGGSAAPNGFEAYYDASYATLYIPNGGGGGVSGYHGLVPVNTAWHKFELEIVPTPLGQTWVTLIFDDLVRYVFEVAPIDLASDPITIALLAHSYANQYWLPRYTVAAL